MKHLLLFLSLLIALSLTAPAYAERCATVHPDKSKQGEIDYSLARFDAGRKQRMREAGLAGPLQRAPGSVRVAVWVHVINKGSGIENGDLPQSMIDEQINVLNQSYAGFYSGSSTPFSFYLAVSPRS